MLDGEVRSCHADPTTAAAAAAAPAAADADGLAPGEWMTDAEEAALVEALAHPFGATGSAEDAKWTYSDLAPNSP